MQKPSGRGVAVASIMQQNPTSDARVEREDPWKIR
jgi:hypothetical protein